MIASNSAVALSHAAMAESLCPPKSSCEPCNDIFTRCNSLRAVWTAIRGGRPLAGVGLRSGGWLGGVAGAVGAGGGAGAGASFCARELFRQNARTSAAPAAIIVFVFI
jgi:hypothetical protein